MASTLFEWVVEELDVSDPSDPEIIDCHYWDENEFDRAATQYLQHTNVEGKPASFGLCKRRFDTNPRTQQQDEADRTYAYAENGALAFAFENGDMVPQRFLDMAAGGI